MTIEMTEREKALKRKVEWIKRHRADTGASLEAAVSAWEARHEADPVSSDCSGGLPGGEPTPLEWLDERIREGRGSVEFGTTEMGDVGLWRRQGVAKMLGSGDTAEEAILSAMAAAG